MLLQHNQSFSTLRTTVDVFKASEHLIQEELVVFWSQVIVCFDDLVKISLHQLKHNKNVLKIARRRW